MLIYTYNFYSKGSRALSKALNIKRVNNNKRLIKNGTYLINWGATVLPDKTKNCIILNNPETVKETVNKKTFFKKHQHLRYNDKPIFPFFTDDIEEAKEVLNSGKIILCRTVLNGKGGAGITLARKGEDLIPAPLYVKYILKKNEYRVHMFNNEIIDVQEKSHKFEYDNPNWFIRNHANGFIYKRQGINIPQCVLDVAKIIFKESGLDFGAIDIIYNDRYKRAYILEINTAPGLEGITIQKYVNEFNKYK